MERQKHNKLMLERLSKLVGKYPDLRSRQYEPSTLCDMLLNKSFLKNNIIDYEKI